MLPSQAVLEELSRRIETAYRLRRTWIGGTGVRRLGYGLRRPSAYGRHMLLNPQRFRSMLNCSLRHSPSAICLRTHGRN